MKSPAKPGTPVLKRPAELFLDNTNPRLAGHEFSIADQDAILDWLWRNKSVNELVSSISANGYWAHEELFATEVSGRLVVVEGNRRLAAVKILTDPALCSRLRIRDCPKLTPEVAATLQALPVIVASRESLWDYVGFKHVNGPQEWDSIAKAEYIYRVHREFKVPLATIGQSIGDKHDTAQRLYRGYLVLHQAQKQNLFNSDDCFQAKFPFSHLWTALGYSSVQSFLGLTAGSWSNDRPVPKAREDDLRTFLLWIYGSRSNQIPPKIRQQNPDLRRLAEALESPKGIKVLRADLPLDTAVDAKRGDKQLFEDALINAEAQLREAKRFVATGFGGEDDLLKTADAVFALAKSLVNEMKRPN